MSEPPPRVPHMVSLGSSFASGPGLPPYEDRSAARSTRNAAHLVAARLGAELTDASVGGATTASIWAPDNAAVPGARPLQIDAVQLRTDLVTMTVGGNDLGYLSAVYAAALRHKARRIPLIGSALSSRMRTQPHPIDNARIDTLAATVAGIVHEIRRRAPRAVVLIVGYPLIVPTRAIGSGLPFDADDATHLRSIGKALDTALRRAAEQVAAPYVDMTSRGEEHALGAPEPWVAPLYLSPRFPASFHPTELGMRATADAVLDVLGGLPDWPPQQRRSAPDEGPTP